MASSLSFCSFVGFLVILIVLWSGSLYADGCYTSIISFGDSLTDTGNAKHLPSITHQNFPSLAPPYGDTFFHKPTGRCSDGRLIIDFLAESLGLPFIPSVMFDNGTQIGVASEQGMNFAVSGATTLNSSFLEATGIRSLKPDTSLRVQLGWFKQALPAFCANTSDCRKLIGRSLFLVGEIGGNDYNYAIFGGKRINEIKPIVPIVVDTIVSTVNELIELGAQTLVVPGYFPVGCSSIFLTISGSQKKDPTTGCLIELNEFVKFHNEALQNKLNQIRVENPDVNIIYADYYNALMQVYRSPDMFGFTSGALKACCGGVGPYNYNSSAACGSPLATACDQPDTYVNWDGLHFTEATYRVWFKSVYQGPYSTPLFYSLCPTPIS